MTAVEYLISMVKSPEWQDMYIWHKEEVFKTALAMEREQKKKRMEKKVFNQEEWNSKIREASKKWFEENPDYNPAYNYYDSGEIMIPDDPGYYRVPMEMWEEYHKAKYPEYGRESN